ncbi:MAG: hypothetical protein ACLQAH_02505 [Limisphaerales bacterium]
MIHLVVPETAINRRPGTNRARSRVNFTFGSGYGFASNFTGLVSTWNGLKILTLPANGR